MRESRINLSSCSSFFIAAERELSAFFTAVNSMFGVEQARQSAIHWIEELKSMNWPTDDSMPNWRQATLAACARLATLHYSKVSRFRNKNIGK